jgi:hypothetical protein
VDERFPFVTTAKGKSVVLDSICISLPSEGAEGGFGAGLLLLVEVRIHINESPSKLAWLVLRSGQRIAFGA